MKTCSQKRIPVHRSSTLPPSEIFACTLDDVTSPPPGDPPEVITELGDDTHHEVAEAKTEVEGDEEISKPDLGLDAHLTEKSVVQPDDDSNKDAT